jgi:hypothetical protein
MQIEISNAIPYAGLKYRHEKFRLTKADHGYPTIGSMLVQYGPFSQGRLTNGISQNQPRVTSSKLTPV